MEETRVLPEVVRSDLHVFRSACGPELVRSGSSSERGRIDSARRRRGLPHCSSGYPSRGWSEVIRLRRGCSEVGSTPDLCHTMCDEVTLLRPLDYV